MKKLTISKAMFVSRLNDGSILIEKCGESMVYYFYPIKQAKKLFTQYYKSIKK